MCLCMRGWLFCPMLPCQPAAAAMQCMLVHCVESAWLLADTLMPRCPATLRSAGDIVAPSAMRQYPPDACNTLYIEGLPGEWPLLPAVLPLLSPLGYRCCTQQKAGVAAFGQRHLAALLTALCACCPCCS